MPRLLPAAAALAVLLTLAPAAIAKPVHKQALGEYFGPYLPKKLHDCRTCHLPDPPDFKEGDEKPQNAFGERLVAVKQELRKAGKKTTIADRLEAILDEDSDGDGVSNLLEILAGRYPGDPSDRPTDAELAAAKKTVALWKKYRQSYPWRPYEAVKRPAVPAVKNAAWVKTPIDAFIVAEHERVGLTPRPAPPTSRPSPSISGPTCPRSSTTAAPATCPILRTTRKATTNRTIPLAPAWPPSSTS